MAKNFRLYINEDLILHKTITLKEEQTHYLRDVIKYSAGDKINCFDNKNGEFSCQIIDLSKKNCSLCVLEKVKNYSLCPDIWLLFAPLKKDCTDFVIEKATELGCRCIVPVITQYTNTTNIKIERYQAQSIEAAEQCRRTDLPEILPPQTLSDTLKNWDNSRALYFMDETFQSPTFLSILKNNPNNKAAILVGPEGGFSQKEISLLKECAVAQGATLGPRILRAETAALAALSCWQLTTGDWGK